MWCVVFAVAVIWSVGDAGGGEAVSYEKAAEQLKEGDAVVVVDEVVEGASHLLRFAALVKLALERGVSVSGRGTVVNGRHAGGSGAFVVIEGGGEARFSNFTLREFRCPVLCVRGAEGLRISDVLIDSCYVDGDVALVSFEGGRVDVDGLVVARSTVHGVAMVSCVNVSVWFNGLVIENVFASQDGMSPFFVMLGSTAVIKSSVVGRVTSTASPLFCLRSGTRVEFENVTFESNQNKEILAIHNAVVSMERCAFEGNMGTILACTSGSHVTISKCLFQKNFSPSSSMFELSESTFNATSGNEWIWNSALSIISGTSSSSVRISDATFTDNQPQNNVLELNSGTNTTITACKFIHTSPGVSVISVSASQATVTNSFFEQTNSAVLILNNSVLTLTACSFKGESFNRPTITANSSRCTITKSQFEQESYSHVLHFTNETHLILSHLTFAPDRQTALQPRILQQCDQCSFGTFSTPTTTTNWPVIIVLLANTFFVLLILFRYRRVFTRRFLNRKPYE